MVKRGFCPEIRMPGKLFRRLAAVATPPTNVCAGQAGDSPSQCGPICSDPLFCERPNQAPGADQRQGPCVPWSGLAETLRDPSAHCSEPPFGERTASKQEPKSQRTTCLPVATDLSYIVCNVFVAEHTKETASSVSQAQQGRVSILAPEPGRRLGWPWPLIIHFP